LPKFLIRILASLSSELKYELLGIALFTAALLSFISLAGFNTGPVGRFAVRLLHYSFGIGSFVVPSALLFISLRYLWKHNEVKYAVKFWGFTLIYIFSLAVYHHYKIPAGQEILPENLIPGGGLVGGFTLFTLRKFFGVDGTIIILGALIISAILMVTTWSIAKTMLLAKEKASETITTAKEAIASTSEMAESFLEAASKKCHFYDQEQDEAFSSSRSLAASCTPEEKPERALAVKKEKIVPEKIEPVADINNENPNPVTYKVPPLALLKKAIKFNSAKINKEITDNARILEETLENFGVSARIVNTSQGPTVTRYELEPAPGVKVSRIVNLSDDIALKLAAPGIRIEAPIPGKAAIGIEVPNKDVSMVPLRGRQVQ
jgi:S-DNA-T family DNA segregation ATPase FtsK/SpoIIIE